MARSDMRRPALAALAAVSALACAGCDLVVGMSGDPRPCGDATFTRAPTAIVPATQFSIDWDEHVALITIDGVPARYSLVDHTQTSIDLGSYVPSALSLSPEGDGLFFTAMIDPPALMAAALEDTVWHTGQQAPKGTYAGTPSADEFGPRRVLVRVRDASSAVQEFEDKSGVWVAVGEPHDVPGIAAPNLTPNGLTMVYAGGQGNDGIFQATRSSPAEWFGEPHLVLAGVHLWPQLLGRCSNLYVIDDSTLTRYER